MLGRKTRWPGGVNRQYGAIWGRTADGAQNQAFWVARVEKMILDGTGQKYRTGTGAGGDQK